MLVSAGFPLLHLPALANPHAVLVSQTVIPCFLLRLRLIHGFFYSGRSAVLDSSGVGCGEFVL